MSETITVEPFPPMANDESTMVTAEQARRINASCRAMEVEIKDLTARAEKNNRTLAKLAFRLDDEVKRNKALSDALERAADDVRRMLVDAGPPNSTHSFQHALDKLANIRSGGDATRQRITAALSAAKGDAS